MPNAPQIEVTIACPFCKEPLSQNAQTCQHCGSHLATTITQSEPKVSQDIHTQIDALDMSEGMKENMHFLHDHILGTKIFGLPKYQQGVGVWTMCSVWAFFFSFLYYLVKGMWRKVLILLIVGFAVNVGAELLNLSGSMAYIGSMIICVIASMSAYYDIYRQKVLKQIFWW